MGAAGRHANFRTPAAGPSLACWLVGGLLTAVACAGLAQAPRAAERRTLGAAGFVVISAGRDSTAGFRWLAGPGPDRRSLVWPAGTLSIPRDLPVEDFSENDLGLTCTGDLAGVGSSGNLLWREGEYRISEPILVSDGVIFLHLTAGKLQVRGERISYQPPPRKGPPPDPKAGYLFLGGMVLLIAVLLRRTWQKSRMRS